MQASINNSEAGFKVKVKLQSYSCA